MSFVICLKEAIDGKVISLSPFRDAWVGIPYGMTYDFYGRMGLKGIQEINGMTGSESINILERGIGEMAEEEAKAILIKLLDFAKARPDGIWDMDPG